MAAAVDPRTPTMTTALEIVKGALSAVIGFPIGKSTIGSRISEGNKARITVVSQSSVRKEGVACLGVVLCAGSSTDGRIEAVQSSEACVCGADCALPRCCYLIYGGSGWCGVQG